VYEPPLTFPGMEWWAGYAYLGRGLAILRPHLALYLKILVVYALPSLIAAYLLATVSVPNLWQEAAILCLPWITAVLGANG
jgi:hypothetical protein